MRSEIRGEGGSKVHLFVRLESEPAGAVPNLQHLLSGTPATAIEVRTPATQELPANAVEVKLESTEGHSDERIAHNELADSAIAVDWAKAYEVVFRMFKNTSNISTRTCRLPDDAVIALPVVEGDVKIAEHSGCIQVVASAFKSLASD